ncbi:MAG: hypothetical protein IJY59_08965 [Bacteroidaceae bacterium]|nr:hypothetical protein [Bacteroidaceae bacterium]
MNPTNEPQKTAITLEMISQQKAEKLAEIRASKQRITDTVSQIFHPNNQPEENNMLINRFGSGIAIFNGIITGFKIIKRMRNLFRRK